MFTAHDIDSLKRGIPLERRAATEIERLHEKLAQIVVVCDDNANVPHPDLALKFVREVASS